MNLSYSVNNSVHIKKVYSFIKVLTKFTEKCLIYFVMNWRLTIVSLLIINVQPIAEVTVCGVFDLWQHYGPVLIWSVLMVSRGTCYTVLPISHYSTDLKNEEMYQQRQRRRRRPVCKPLIITALYTIYACLCINRFLN